MLASILISIIHKPFVMRRLCGNRTEPLFFHRRVLLPAQDLLGTPDASSTANIHTLALLLWAHLRASIILLLLLIGKRPQSRWGGEWHGRKSNSSTLLALLLLSTASLDPETTFLLGALLFLLLHRLESSFFFALPCGVLAGSSTDALFLGSLHGCILLTESGLTSFLGFGGGNTLSMGTGFGFSASLAFDAQVAGEVAVAQGVVLSNVGADCVAEAAGPAHLDVGSISDVAAGV
jgi:hypothetical protein